jgi:hypothetical protein
VANCVYAAMDTVQPSSLRSLSDSASTQSRLFELPQGDDSVLPTRDRSHLPVDEGGFVSHEDTKPPKRPTSPPSSP